MLKRLAYNLGNGFRETGQTLDRIGSAMQGNFAYKEQLCRHRRVMPLYDLRPKLAHNVFVAPNATVVGDVKLGEGSSVWYGTVVRGDVSPVEIGENSSIGHRTVVHVTGGSQDKKKPTRVGNRVVVGNGVILHGCTLEDESKVEDGAIVYDGAVVQKHAIVGAGAVVTQNKVVGSGQYWEGNPAKHVRNVTEEEKQQLLAAAGKLQELALLHAKETQKSTQDLAFDDMVEESYALKPGTRLD
ncbi:Gamma carbonic anhydrase family protein [Balamuthia mandrillaris]